jgi:F-type H+-transporting ATPase subunit delta
MTKVMRGISAASLEDVLATVESSSAGSGESAATLGGEIFAVVSVLDESASLRRVLTDPSTEAAAKEQLAATILGAKVGPGTLDVVKTAVRGRWASGRDMVDGLETAGVTALVASADAAGDLDRLETELFEVDRVVATDPELRSVVTDRSVPVAPRNALLDRLLSQKVLPQTLSLVHQAVVARGGSFERVLSGFADTAAARRQRVVALVRVAYELGDAERGRLTSAVSAKYGQDVHLNIVIDPSVVGGVAVSVAGEVVDGTMSSRLESARRQLAG